MEENKTELRSNLNIKPNIMLSTRVRNQGPWTNFAPYELRANLHKEYIDKRTEVFLSKSQLEEKMLMMFITEEIEDIE